MNAFDEAWNSAAEQERTIFGGENVTVGVTNYPVVVLEFDVQKVIGRTGGATDQIAGQVVMRRTDWDTISAPAKNTVPGTLRGISVRLQKPTDSPDVTDVVLNVLAVVSN